LASTGSKGKKFPEAVRDSYPEDVYVTPVKGRGVVNTLPIGTIRFLQGQEIEARETIVENAEKAEAVLDGAGIDLEQAGKELIEAGLGSFIKDFGTIQARIKQGLMMGAHQDASKFLEAYRATYSDLSMGDDAGSLRVVFKNRKAPLVEDRTILLQEIRETDAGVEFVGIEEGEVFSLDNVLGQVTVDRAMLTFETSAELITAFEDDVVKPGYQLTFKDRRRKPSEDRVTINIESITSFGTIVKVHGESNQGTFDTRDMMGPFQADRAMITESKSLGSLRSEKEMYEERIADMQKQKARLQDKLGELEKGERWFVAEEMQDIEKRMRDVEDVLAKNKKALRGLEETDTSDRAIRAVVLEELRNSILSQAREEEPQSPFAVGDLSSYSGRETPGLIVWDEKQEEKPGSTVISIGAEGFRYARLRGKPANFPRADLRIIHEVLKEIEKEFGDVVVKYNRATKQLPMLGSRGKVTYRSQREITAMGISYKDTELNTPGVLQDLSAEIREWLERRITVATASNATEGGGHTVPKDLAMMTLNNGYELAEAFQRNIVGPYDDVTFRDRNKIPGVDRVTIRIDRISSTLEGRKIIETSVGGSIDTADVLGPVTIAQEHDRTRRRGAYGKDNAQLTKEALGGIDLNPELLDLQIKRDGNNVPLPLPQQPIETMKIDGFMPVIINITPITDMPFIIGAGEGEEEPTETSSGSDLLVMNVTRKFSLN